MTSTYATIPCAGCGAPVDPRWLGRCRTCEPSLHCCEECGETAVSKRNLGGIACWRCARCAEVAERQATADVALAHSELTFGSLFAGIGGFDLGLERAGLQCVWQVERDSACRSVLARHWPNVPRFEDVCECGARNLSGVDVLCGGFPCQDLSVAGKRAGLGGSRSGLFYEMTRIADELRPACLLWENVPGLLSSRGGRDFLAVLMELERIGYYGCWTTLDAQFFGLAQRRQRVFGLFARGDIGATRCAEILSLAARLPWNTEASRAKRASIAASVTASAGHHGRSSPRGDGSDNLIAATLTGQMQGQSNQWAPTNEADNLIFEPYTFDWMAGVAENDRAWLVDKPGHARSLTAHRTLAVVTTEGVTGALNSSNGGADDNSAQAGHVVAVQHAQIGRHDSAGPQGKGYQWDVAFTQDSRSSSDAVAGTFGVRRLTPIECERLQGFPDDWTEGQPDSTRYRQLGNAVAVPVAKWIGKRIVDLA